MVNIVKKQMMNYKIMQAFWTLYQQKNLQQISVREIIEQVPCNRSTFYDILLIYMICWISLKITYYQNLHNLAYRR